jgi:hypothetical protein
MNYINPQRLHRIFRWIYGPLLIRVIVGLFCFQLGCYLSGSLPVSIVTHPVKTLQTMKTCSVGSEVFVDQVPFTFAPRENASRIADPIPATVVGYREITYKGEFILLCTVSLRDTNDTSVDVNPLWLTSKM